MIPLLGKCLKFLSQVAVVAVGPDRDPAANGGVEIPGILLPLLEGVVLEELLIEFPADLGDNDLLGVGGVVDRDALGGQPSLELFAGALTAKELLEGVEIDWEVPVAPVGVAQDLVLDGMPLGELREIHDDARGIGPEIVWAVFVNKNPSRIVFILGIAPDMAPLLNDRALCSKLGGESFR